MNGRSFTSLLDVPEGGARRHRRPLLVSVTRRVPATEATVDALLARFDPGVPGAAAWAEGGGGPALVAEGAAWRAPGSERGAPGWPDAARAWRELVATGRIEGSNGGVAGPTLVGAAAFDAGAPTGGLWAAFGHGRLVLPRRMWTLVGERLCETRNRVLWGEEPASESPPAAAARARGEERARFVARVEAARAAIVHGDLQKLVVARRQDVPSALAPTDVLRRLAARERGTFTFALAAPGAVFLGSTPELLARARGSAVESECLAGTTGRGDGAREDRRLGALLRGDVKEQEEHDLVRQGVRAALERTCEAVELEPRPRLRALRDVQHLATAVRARLRPGFGLLDVASDLHPTPAVAGLPVPQAVAWLRARENLERGLYGGPVGYLTASGDGTFAVALRSGLVRPTEGVGHLYAGCGIVAASQPEREWQESRLKLRTMAAALGVEA